MAQFSWILIRFSTIENPTEIDHVKRGHIALAIMEISGRLPSMSDSRFECNVPEMSLQFCFEHSGVFLTGHIECSQRIVIVRCQYLHSRV